MITEAIIHQPTREFRYPTGRNRLVVRLRAKRQELKSCQLFYWNRYFKEQTGECCAPMICFARDGRFDYFETEIQAKNDVICYTKYYFELSDGKQTVWLGAYGIGNQRPETDFFEYLYPHENDIPTVPSWAGEAIFYQIFPERFCNGNPGNDHPSKVDWNSKPTRDNFLGGDLAGIIQRLDYLAELGINAVYLNPVFLSDSNHKYDTIDYFQIDPNFGTLDEAKQLITECHRRGIKVILDGVFNHCGIKFPPFQDLLEQGEDSVYKDWFYISQSRENLGGLEYECVGYYRQMPKLNLSHPETGRYFLDVVSYWMKTLNIDGWRLDVADEVEYTFWQNFRRRVKEINPDALIIGETWHEAKDMLYGDQMDTVMNYVFRDAVVGFFADNSICCAEFDSRLNNLLALYPRTITFAMYNLLGSHDTERFLTRCNNNKDAFKLAVAFQMTFVGMPAVYYGDEVGMTGDNDPDCRVGMIWNEALQDREILSWYQRLIRIRKAHPALRSGSFHCNLCDDNHHVYGFLRKLPDQQIYVLLNNSPADVLVSFPVELDYRQNHLLRDLLTDRSYAVLPLDNPESYYNADRLNYRGLLQLDVQAYTACILIKKAKGEF